jgi:N-carbamoylputrescine amidase
MSKVKVGTVQMTCVKDKETNLQKAIEKVREAAKGAQIVFARTFHVTLFL